MEDHEFVLRFLAFKLTPYNEYKAKSLDNFLNETMAEINKMSAQELKNIEHIFLQTMTAAFDIFGQYAFRKLSKDRRRKSPINKALFEAWSVNLSQFSE
jgi:hypothetical protein